MRRDNILRAVIWRRCAVLCTIWIDNHGPYDPSYSVQKGSLVL